MYYMYRNQIMFRGEEGIKTNSLESGEDPLAQCPVQSKVWAPCALP